MTESFSGHSLNSHYGFETAGSSTIYLGQLQGSITSILWYPDERSILIVMEGRDSPGDIHAWRAEFLPLPLVGSILGPGGYPIAFSPVASFIAFARDGARVLRDLHTGEDRVLPVRFVLDGLVWLPDGSGFFAFNFDKEAGGRTSPSSSGPLNGRPSSLRIGVGHRHRLAQAVGHLPDQAHFAHVAREMSEPAGVDLLTICRQ